ncbi:hypothetical protein P152DRAFT_463566 [Eremomyces bilateralis CBS 781.70]|uniref:Guanine nucleotide exchange factor Vps9 n=1 Tax=Eremomyces bilateralis CBS 781.70 TaxID=1392243 RepID=A0A6G1GH72_9PEZI|nr:uncharacterized protein P152DRAFT_463566 [Eremomyces bilateralis CBS 781.70]KAF1817403.1 hypothetical protein P152DRAFT_463566 [Eremomyces bilateralis CBS 781.70]
MPPESEPPTEQSNGAEIARDNGLETQKLGGNPSPDVSKADASRGEEMQSSEAINEQITGSGQEESGGVQKDEDKESSGASKQQSEGDKPEGSSAGDETQDTIERLQALAVEPPKTPTTPLEEKELPPNLSPPPPPPKDEKYSPSSYRDPEKAAFEAEAETADAEEYNEKSTGGKPSREGADDARSEEIQTIMEQFDEGHEGPGADEILSPRMELANPLLDSPILHPPRRSSLEPLSTAASGISSPPSQTSSQSPALKSPPPRSSSLQHLETASEKTSSPKPPSSIFKPPPPEPDPEPDLPFDFHRFLEQLRHRTADPVAKFLRSFLLEFGKKQWMVHEQVKIISDFLEFISKKMAQCEVWRTVSDAEFDNAKEGMEKLVMNRLYNQTFSPAIPSPEPIAESRGKRRAAQSPIRYGRRGQHQEDVERDEVLGQKVRIYGWVREAHLDIKPVGEKGMKFLKLAQQELLKINTYRAPRDKVICILNCCKVIFGFLRNTPSADQSADSFVPLLIYVVLHARPDHLVSNVQYILRFRDQDKLGGEAGYYISSLMGTIQFIENLDRTSITISDEEFEKHVEAAVSVIAERHAEDFNNANPPPSSPRKHHASPHPTSTSTKSTPSRPKVSPRPSLDEVVHPSPRRPQPLRPLTPDDPATTTVPALLRTIQKPLSSIGRIFSDDAGASSDPAPRLAPAPPTTPGRRSSDGGPRRSAERPRDASRDDGASGLRADQDPGAVATKLSAEDAAARQASVEMEHARRIQLQEHAVVVETLAGMFPGLDREVIDDVVRMKEGRVGQAVDACLALSN